MVQISQPADLLPLSGLAQAAVHKPDQIELISPSYFTKLELLDGDNNLVFSIMSALSSGNNHTLASEGRPLSNAVCRCGALGCPAEYEE
jgi:hypothetical protein